MIATETFTFEGRAGQRLDGRLDALVNNAGVSPKGADGARLNTLDTDLMTWGKVFHVNFFASVVLARGLKDELAAAKGSVVNVTSIAGSRVHPFAGAAYATSKAALAALTREMAHDFGPLGVRVNAIGPGPTMQGHRQSAEHFRQQRQATISGRGASPADITAALGYFMDAPAVTGQILCIDGGQHLAWQTPDVLGPE